MKESVANLQFYVNNTTNKKNFIQRSAVLQPTESFIGCIYLYKTEDLCYIIFHWLYLVCNTADLCIKFFLLVVLLT
jgi:hypothetical protein